MVSILSRLQEISYSLQISPQMWQRFSFLSPVHLSPAVSPPAPKFFGVSSFFACVSKRLNFQRYSLLLQTPQYKNPEKTSAEERGEVHSDLGYGVL
jgi:hypothetical protein